MIEQEVLDILKLSDDEAGDSLNEFADGFRAERNPRQLLELLASENREVIATGAWVLGEISTDRYDSEGFRRQLKELLHHEYEMVRFYSIGALYSIADEEAKTLLNSLRDDPNEGVRGRAKAAMKRFDS